MIKREAKSIFSRIKAELIEDGRFRSIEEALPEIFSYIEAIENLKSWRCRKRQFFVLKISPVLTFWGYEKTS